MNPDLSRALTAAASLLCGASASATGAAQTVLIDTEQKAAAAFVTALHTGGEMLNHHIFVMQRTVSLSNLALRTAASVTTPVALMATPGGVEVPCATSGKMTARMAPRIPRVFRFEWHDCQRLQDGFPQTLDGSGEVVLLSDSFFPEKVAAIRFGSAGNDLVEKRDVVFPSFEFHDLELRNLRVVGSIPMVNTFVAMADSFFPFAYLVSGFDDLTQTYEDKSSGSPPSSVEYHTGFDSVAFVGSNAFDADTSKFEEDLSALFGTLTYTRHDPPPYGVTSEIYRFAGLHVHNSTTFTNFEHSQTIDGRLDFTWNPNFGSGCMNGAYSFATRTPLHYIGNGFAPYDAGDLLINGTDRVTLYSAATVPPTLPTPTLDFLIHIDAANVGTFNYDVSDILNGLRDTSHCM